MFAKWAAIIPDSQITLPTITWIRRQADWRSIVAVANTLGWGQGKTAMAIPVATLVTP